MSDAYFVPCFYCAEPVDPNSKQTWRQVMGWERKAIGQTRRGGSDIACRSALDEYAHAACIRRLQAAVPPTQEALL